MLQEREPGLNVSLLGVTTEGDRRLEASLAKIGGKGLFVKELEQALIDGRADIAVHSMKDVPMRLPDGFQIAAMLARDEVRDAFVSNRYKELQSLPKGSVRHLQFASAEPDQGAVSGACRQAVERQCADAIAQTRRR